MKTYLFIISLLILNYLNADAQTSEIKSSKSFMITHSLSQQIDVNTSVSCNSSGVSYENSYYRAFDLYNFFKINGDWVVNSIDLGIGLADAGIGTSQQIYVNFYTMNQYNSNIILDSLTLIANLPITVNDSYSGLVVNFPLSTQFTVPKGRVLVIEVLIPDSSDEGNVFFIGSNNLGQTDKSYIRAPQCGVDAPTDVADILYPEMMSVINLYGDYASPNPEIMSFSIENQIIQTEILNDPDYSIKVVMPADADLTALTPQIEIPAGYIITPASGDIVDFSTGLVAYTVTNEFRKISKTWMADVVNATPDILSFSLSSQIAEAVIKGEPDYTIDINVENGTDLSTLKPVVSVYSDFQVLPISGAVVDFSLGPVTYTVSHSSLPITQDWTVNVSEVSSAKNISKRDIQIYPNPASEKLIIKTNGYKKIIITDMTGQEIKNKVSNDYITEINLNQINNGIYIVKIIEDEGIYSDKIIILK